ncbi:MAG: hypothetical protein K2X72_15970 [Reyranella sp.]|nr:hypothetical protein [Reyranella sp.]
MTSLVGNLGGTAGFGENVLPANDDGSTPFIDVTSVFGVQGLNFFGHNYTGFYINNNGSVTFTAPSSSFTPTALTGSTSNPVIAPFWADVDTRGGHATPTPGGTSTGSNLVYYDLDSPNGVFTATWDDVGYYSSQTNKLNAFQLQLINEGNGDFDIVFRYENVDWTTGSASGGSNGLGGTAARAGYSSGNGTNYFELPQSGNQADLLALETASNRGIPGIFIFEVRSGVPAVSVSVGDASSTEGNGPGSHTITIPVVLTQPSSSTITIHYTTADGSAHAGEDYVAQSGTLTFAPGVTQQDIVVAINGDTVAEGDETFTVTLSNPSGSVSILDGTATATIVSDDIDATLSIAATSADHGEGQSGNAPFLFTVTRTGDTSGTATAHWAVTGAAVNGGDFADGILPSGVVSFAAGEISKVIEIDVAGDSQVEADETFSVTLSQPGANTVIGTASASGTIRNDDAALSIAAVSADKVEGDVGATAFTFTVTRTGDTTSAASVDWAVSGTAVSASDFIPSDGLLSYADLYSYLASLFEAISPGFSSTNNIYSYLGNLFEAFPGGGPVSGDGLPSGTVSFAAGETSKTITVWALGEMVVEEDESFSVTLSNASAGTVIDTGSAVGTIRNDDDEPETFEDVAASLMGGVVSQFFLGGGDGPSLKYAGADVAAGTFAAWTPLAMQEAGNGYHVVWKNGTADQYILWNVDGDGNWTSQTGILSGSDMALQTAELAFQQDFNADGTIGLITTPIETSGATRLDQVANEFFLRDGGGDGPSLKYAGADVLAGQFGGWTPLGAETAGSGYEIVWKNGNADQYILWTVDGGGHWTSQSAVVSGSDLSLETAELAFHQDFNADGTIGLITAAIETSGATRLDQVANAFFLHDGGGSGPSLKYAGADVVAGQFGAWTPLGAEKTESGYQVVWKNGNADQYILWTVDSAGHWTSQSAVVSGSSLSLQTSELAFQQDFNADGMIGLRTTSIEKSGDTRLDQVANEFFLRNGEGNGPSLKYAGADVVAGQFGAWTPLGAEKTADGYEVAWKNGAADQYVIWDVDAHGNAKGMTDILSGASPVLEVMESHFHQDLNHDGIIG